MPQPDLGDWTVKQTENLPGRAESPAPGFVQRQQGARRLRAAQIHPIVLLRKARRLMAEIIAWLVGLLMVGVGGWILIVRFEGLVTSTRIA